MNTSVHQKNVYDYDCCKLQVCKFETYNPGGVVFSANQSSRNSFLFYSSIFLILVDDGAASSSILNTRIVKSVIIVPHFCLWSRAASLSNHPSFP